MTDEGSQQATRFTCPECGATLDVKGDAATAMCAYCGKSARLQRRTKLMQRPIKLPPAKPDEPAPVARAHREWSVVSVLLTMLSVVGPLAVLGLVGYTAVTEWHNT